MRGFHDDEEDEDDYMDVQAVALRTTEKAVLLKTPDVTDWVPRSCLHGADDLFLHRPLVDEVHTYRVRGWVARQKGF